MVTLEQFRKLKRGDVVLFGKRKVARVVQCGPANWTGGRKGGIDSICFAIMRRSWTNRARTSYGYNDVKHLLFLPPKKLDTKTVQAENEQRLKDIGFNVKKEKLREMKEHKKHCDRLKGWAEAPQFKCSPGYSWRVK